MERPHESGAMAPEFATSSYFGLLIRGIAKVTIPNLLKALFCHQ
jgi:hypothetical protein